MIQKFFPNDWMFHLFSDLILIKKKHEVADDFNFALWTFSLKS